MKTVNVSELEGAALDWATGVSLGHKVQHSNNVGGLSISEPYSKNDRCIWSPSTDWSHGGPLIESKKVWISAPIGSRNEWDASVDTYTTSYLGPTPLIAACRAIVAGKFGDTVEVPEELL